MNAADYKVHHVPLVKFPLKLSKLSIKPNRNVSKIYWPINNKVLINS